MRVCPKCGFRDSIYWRNSRFEFNNEYMAPDDFEREYPELWGTIKDLPNGQKIEIGNDEIIFWRGKRVRYIYRCYIGDYKVPRERVRH